MLIIEDVFEKHNCWKLHVQQFMNPKFVNIYEK